MFINLNVFCNPKIRSEFFQATLLCCGFGFNNQNFQLIVVDVDSGDTKSNTVSGFCPVW